MSFDFGGQGEGSAPKESVEIRTFNTMERMERRVKRLREELVEVEEAMELLKKNPAIERLLTLMGKIRL